MDYFTISVQKKSAIWAQLAYTKTEKTLGLQ